MMVRVIGPRTNVSNGKGDKGFADNNGEILIFNGCGYREEKGCFGMEIALNLSLAVVGNILLVLLIKALYNIKIKPRKLFLFVLATSLMIVFLYMQMYNSIIRPFIGIACYIILIKYLFDISLKRSVIAVGLFYISLAIVEVILSLIVVRYLNYTAEQWRSNVPLFLLSYLMYFTVISVVILSCMKLRERLKHEKISEPNLFISLYVIAALIVVTSYIFSIQDVLFNLNERVIFINLAVVLISLLRALH